ncbi:hypothetical protein PV371_37780, partial [Streptomyces sp. TX20-6-3]|uniref:hypothetical protein n=1 Tax=Streptomyces sp. TX20-6-3 TaxID=3028705 RepID=UPI0029A73709
HPTRQPGHQPGRHQPEQPKRPAETTDGPSRKIEASAEQSALESAPAGALSGGLRSAPANTLIDFYLAVAACHTADLPFLALFLQGDYISGCGFAFSCDLNIYHCRISAQRRG